VNDRPLSVAAYIRVSSKGQDYEYQRQAIGRCASGHLEPGPLALYREKTSATAGLERPELDRLRAAIRAGNVRVLYVWRLDRLVRSGIRDALEIVQECRAHDCQLVSASDGIDFNGPAADVVVAVLAWAAQMELQARGERIAARRALAEERGEPWGRPSRISPAIRKDIAARRAAGEPVRSIARALHMPRSTVAAVARRPVPA
jgi:site-specific DNA recombinase